MGIISDTYIHVNTGGSENPDHHLSSTGNTESMAVAVAKGANKHGGVVVQLKEIGTVGETDFLSVNAIILGSPVYNAKSGGTGS